MRRGRSRVVGALICGVLSASLHSQRTVAASPESQASSQNQAAAQSIAKKSFPVWIHLSGDLDSMSLVRRFAAELDTANKSAASAIVIEIDSDRARPDVAWELAKLVTGQQTPVLGYLRDSKDHRVGLCAAMLSICCANSVIDSQTTVRAAPDDDLRDLAHDAADLEQASRRLSGEVTMRLTARGALAEFAELVTTFGERLSPAWVVFDPYGAPTIVTEPPSDTRAIKLVTKSAQGEPILTLDPETASKLKMVNGAAPTETAALRLLGIASSPRAKVFIEGGIQKDRDKACRELDEADSSIERAKATLDLPDPPNPSTSADRYRRAAKSAEKELSSAAEAIARCERLADEFPEILRLPACGQTTAAASQVKHHTKWRAAIQSRRDKLTKLSTRAELFRGQ